VGVLGLVSLNVYTGGTTYDPLEFLVGVDDLGGSSLTEHEEKFLAPNTKKKQKTRSAPFLAT
jgi:hypothetical protein